MSEQTTESKILEEPTDKLLTNDETTKLMLRALLTFQYDAYAHDDSEDGMPVNYSRKHAAYTNVALIEHRLTGVLEATNGHGDEAEVMMWAIGSSFKVLIAFFLAAYIKRDLPHSEKLWPFLTVVQDRTEAFTLRQQLEAIIEKIKGSGKSEELLTELAAQVSTVIDNREALYLRATAENLDEAMTAPVDSETLKTYLNAETELLGMLWMPEEGVEAGEPLCKPGELLYDIVELAMFMIVAEQNFNNGTVLNIRGVRRLLDAFGEDLKTTNWGDKFMRLEELVQFGFKDLDPDTADGDTPVRLRLSIKPTECVLEDGVYTMEKWSEGEFQAYSARVHTRQDHSLCRSMIALGGVDFDMTTPLSDTFRRV